MQLDSFVDAVQRDLRAALPEDTAAAAHADRLSAALDSSLRLALITALARAADELSEDLSPGGVRLGLSGGEPRLSAEGLVAAASAEPAEAPPTPPGADDAPASWQPAEEAETQDDETARVSLRLPTSLKSQAERAAAAGGVSLNTWLVRAIQGVVRSSLAAPGAAPAPPRSGRRHVSGWMN